jgi:SAM-dependent methyltransferase
MAHYNQRQFCERIKLKFPNHFKNVKVLDMGSLDINGSNRNLFENSDYLGIDVGNGPNVDLNCVGHEFEAPDNYYDTIITTEMLEHDMYYEKSIKNIIRMLKPGGLFVMTCATTGREEHGTRKTTPQDAPLLEEISIEWSDYYKNLIKEDFLSIDGFKCTFPDGIFEIGNENFDLYFSGIKNGIDYLKYFI